MALKKNILPLLGADKWQKLRVAVEVSRERRQTNFEPDLDIYFHGKEVIQVNKQTDGFWGKRVEKRRF
jgi:hypothetical protein